MKWKRFGSSVGYSIQSFRRFKSQTTLRIQSGLGAKRQASKSKPQKKIIKKFKIQRSKQIRLDPVGTKIKRKYQWKRKRVKEVKN